MVHVPGPRVTSSKATGWPGVPEARRRIMRSNTRRDTSPERAIRSALHAAGLRFRVDFPIKVAGGRPIRPDVVFPRRRVAVFIDSCWWHSCPEHGTTPKTNAEYWVPKLKSNVERDREQTARLRENKWQVLRIWTHVSPHDAVELVRRALEGNRTGRRRS
jgi:DNA mismatch endonuclease (patch repair protein)